MANKKQVRAAFRDAVFKRDGYKCLMCGKKADPKSPEDVLDAHHIQDRHLFPNGGYVKENGISLCKHGTDKQESCHEKAELWHASSHNDFHVGFLPHDLYAKIGSSYEKAQEADKRL